MPADEVEALGDDVIVEDSNSNGETEDLT